MKHRNTTKRNVRTKENKDEEVHSFGENDLVKSLREDSAFEKSEH